MASPVGTSLLSHHSKAFKQAFKGQLNMRATTRPPSDLQRAYRLSATTLALSGTTLVAYRLSATTLALSGTTLVEYKLSATTGHRKGSSMLRLDFGQGNKNQEDVALHPWQSPEHSSWPALGNFNREHEMLSSSKQENIRSIKMRAPPGPSKQPGQYQQAAFKPS
eukprot:1148634-Pelagomonas_calceolata.AAC.2